MSSIAQKTLENITLVTVTCRLFHGNRKLSANDMKKALGITIDTDASKAVMALGVKRVFDKKELSKLANVKRDMHKHCSLVGTPFLGGYAVPNHKAHDLADKLEALKNKGISVKADLLLRYDEVLEKYAEKNPNWQDIIKASAFTPQYVEQQISFMWNGMSISPGDKDGVMAKNLTTKVGGLLGDLLIDIAKEARTLTSQSLSGKTGVTRHAFRPLLKMADKLDGFVFMDSRVGKLAEMIRHILLVMPTDGRIEGADLRNLVFLTSILEEPDKALKLAQQAEESGVLDTYDSVFGGMAGNKVLPLAVNPPVAMLVSTPSLAETMLHASDSPGSTTVFPPAPTYTELAYVVSPDANPFGF